MRVKLFYGIIMISIAATLVACSGKYEDAEKVYTEFADTMEIYLQNLDKAEDADAVAAAINDFADDMDELAPRLKEVAMKYPELKDPNNIPANLQPIKKRSDEMAMQMAGTFMKVMPHMKEEKVKAAFDRLGKAMTSVEK